MASYLKNKTIALGVSGGIACYKAVELLRLLMNEGAQVYVVMSENAKRFVTPLTFEALSRHPVYHQIFDSGSSYSMEHIQAAEKADLLVVAPATANMIGKMANGLADDALSTLFVSFRGPVSIAPAMNDGMYSNPAVKANIETLRRRGASLVEPEHGELACGSIGQGRLAEPERILRAVIDRFAAQQDLAGCRFLVTAGPTHEPLDPVRYLTNPSSGKMGFAVAERAHLRGAEVTLISGPTQLTPPQGIKFLKCQRAVEMKSLTLEFLPDCDVLVMTAAVGDFAPERAQKEKIKKRGDEPLILKLWPTPDILKEVSRNKTHQYIVGFAAETENLIQSAGEKLKNKGLDMIVANDISSPGIGFRSDSNQVFIIDKTGRIENLPKLSKKEIADSLLDRIKAQIVKT